MKIISIFIFLSTFILSSNVLAQTFTKDQKSNSYSVGKTYYKVTKKEEHQPFIKTLIVNYRCSSVETWKRYFYRYGSCDVLNSKFDSKKNNFLIKVIKETDQTNPDRKCLKSSSTVLRLKAKDLCG